MPSSRWRLASPVSILVREQPVERVVDLAVRDLAQLEPLAKARGGGTERPNRRQLRGGRNHPVDDERQNQVAIASGRRSAEPFGQKLRQVQELGRAEHRGDVPVRQRPADGERLIRRLQRHAAAQQRSKSLHQLLGPVGQIGERAFLDLPVGAVALPQKDRRMRLTVRHRFDVHGATNRDRVPLSRQNMHKCMAT